MGDGREGWGEQVEGREGKVVGFIYVRCQVHSWVYASRTQAGLEKFGVIQMVFKAMELWEFPRKVGR